MSDYSMDMPYRLTGGLDIGNGYVKGVIRGYNDDREIVDVIDCPSVAVSIARSAPRVPLDNDDAVRAIDDDWYNRLMVSYDTPLVDRSDLRILGRSALTTPGSKITQFDIASSQSKADQELSFVLVLGLFAAKAIRDYVRLYQVLPDRELSVRVHVGLALPIVEYIRYRVSYADRFMGQSSLDEPVTHLVTVKNFVTPVRVRLQFDDVRVLPEGASAQFAIIDKGVPLAEALLDDLRASSGVSGARVDGLTAEMLVGARHTVGIDVGEGTTNFCVFTDARFNPEASSTLDRGYGTALTHALDQMHGDQDLRFTNRKALADFLATSPSAFVQDRYDRAMGYVTPEMEYLGDEIGSHLADVLTGVGHVVEVIYVYGGGSGPIKDVLRPVVQRVAGSIPVLYLDASYSRFLNREGLYLAATLAADRGKVE